LAVSAPGLSGFGRYALRVLGEDHMLPVIQNEHAAS
jgi:hypothetical protein